MHNLIIVITSEKCCLNHHHRLIHFPYKKCYLWRRQSGGVVRAPDLKSGGHRFKSRSDHFSVDPSSAARSCL